MLVSWAKALALPIKLQKICWILLGEAGEEVKPEKTKYMFISDKPSVRQDHDINI
jgi:hypothetical protein